jgi:4'-phosphopantetheinyl transferase
MDVDVTRFAAARSADFAQRALPLHRLAPPARDEVHVWHLDLGRLSASLQAALDRDAPQSGRLRLTPGQLRFTRRFYLRLLLGAYLEVPGKSVRLVRNPRGKPVLDASAHPEPLHFSMAKSADRLLIGFSSTHPVGVDLEPSERRARNAAGVAARYFSAAESQRLAALEPAALEAAFLRTWACKEAVVKASGLGIANQLCRFSVETDLARPPAVLEFDGAPTDDWSLAVLQPEQRFIGAVAVHGPIARLEARRLVAVG